VGIFYWPLSPAAPSLAWVLRNPVVTTAICGASNPDQLRESRDALKLGGC